MSQTKMEVEENEAAAALVDVAAGLKKAPEPAPSPSVSNLLPTSIASRKQWDRETAAPPSTDASSSNQSPANPPVAATGPSATATANYQSSAPPNHHHTPTTAEYHAVVAASPQLHQHHAHAHVQGARRVQPPPPPPPPSVGAGRVDPAHWPVAPHHPPPPGYPHHHPGHHAAAAHAAAAHAHHAHAAAAAAAHAAATAHTHQPPRSSFSHSQQPASAVLMSMSSIGFGVAPASSTDATEAVIRAVQDSMERSAVRLPTAASLRQSLSIHLKLGVPPGPTGKPMYVDVSRLFLFLPQSVPLLPVEIVVGGLLIDHNEIEEATAKQNGGAAVSSQQPTICTAVACVTLQQSAPEVTQRMQGGPPVSAGGSTTVSTPAPPTTHHTSPPPPPPPHQRTTSLPSQPSGHVSAHGTGPPPPKVHRTNSMEVLAQISGEIRERQLSSARNGGSHEIPHAAAALAMVCSSEAASLETGDSSYDQNRTSFSSKGSLDSNNAYSYKKLAPGMTPKNNKRLFVRHDYKDYSKEEPLPEEKFLLRSDTRTPNAAFPLKLHETLTQIEQDGYGHIIGWMPHGRSFKIHNQQAFVDTILPKWFVMTKKSSFLRQLNLYSFNRISVGPDSGSYYHEKFLRGLKFLSRRMSRQKVNGNGIRAAGNPDEEPTLANYPTCPVTISNSCNNSVSQNQGEARDSDTRDRPYSRLVGGQQQVVRSSSASAGEGTATEMESLTVCDGGSVSVSIDDKGGNLMAPALVTRNDVSPSQASFPLKLQRILDKADEDGRTDVTWLPHGKAFIVRDVEKFVSEVMSQYFNQTKYSSFQRQLHMYNFQRITFGRDKGAYHHDKFQRGRPDLCMMMVRTRVNGKGCRRPGDPDNEPDFYVDWEQDEGSPSGENEDERTTEEKIEEAKVEGVTAMQEV